MGAILLNVEKEERVGKFSKHTAYLRAILMGGSCYVLE